MTTIPDGTLAISVRSGDSTRELTLDLLTLKLAAEPVESKHNIEAGWTPTPAFLADLCGAYAPHIEGCTPTLAYHVWQLMLNEWIELKKNMP